MTGEANDAVHEILRARARKYAQVRQLGYDRTERPTLVFMLGGERYGVDLRRVLGLTRVEYLTPLPSAPQALAGLMSWRGSLLSVVDLEGPLGAPRVGLDDRARVVVVRVLAEGGGSDIGILVGAVDEVRDIDEDDIERLDGWGRLMVGRTADALTILNPDALPALLTTGENS